METLHIDIPSVSRRYAFHKSISYQFADQMLRNSRQFRSGSCRQQERVSVFCGVVVSHN